MRFYFPIWPVFFRRRKENIEAAQAISKAKVQADTLPKEFDYYCSYCLFQTNVRSKICPKCRTGRLVKCK